MITYQQRFKDIDERFWEKVQLEDQVFPENGCMLWMASRTSNGYGQFWENGRQHKVHRWVYERYRGPIPEGMELDHLCRVRHCVNPDHLEAVNHQINLSRGLKHASPWNRGITHCKHGHEFTPENTAVYYRDGIRHRQCRACLSEASKRFWNRRRQ